jgi:hypothetical protein
MIGLGRRERRKGKKMERGRNLKHRKITAQERGEGKVQGRRKERKETEPFFTS